MIFVLIAYQQKREIKQNTQRRLVIEKNVTDYKNSMQATGDIMSSMVLQKKVEASQYVEMASTKSKVADIENEL